MDKGNSKGGLVVGILIGIVIMLVVGGCLVATKTISFSSKASENSKNTETNNKQETSNRKTSSSMIKITLPSGNTITTNKEYESVLNGKEKIIVSSDGEFPYKEAKAYNDELYLEDLLKIERNGYPDDFSACKNTDISNDSFDFDNDGINELIISFCEEHILFHYYDGKVYAYVLGGYRANGNWRIDGTTVFSGSAVNGGYTKYTFNKDKLVSSIILQTDSKIYTDPTANPEDIIYKVNDKEVSKEEYDKKLEEQEKVKMVDFVNYSN